ncbi:MAG: YggS family pyridoxal phosphate-dependent enzyme [Deltaproteobacteria bacterium]|nr:YggS family pyridoxal phosphate-dependent enzyme [Deltaproteobacteria bacterium]
MSIADELARVRDRIARAATAVSRDPNEIRLVAVSKTKPASAVREAYEAGHRDFGENYVQELVQKADELQDLGEIRWHFIGHLQSNKARHVVKVAHMVQTVDSASLVKELGKRVAKEERGALPVLVEVNVGGEPQKHGASPADVGNVIAAIEAEPALALKGLMTIPPNDLEGARRAFEALSSLRSIHGGKAKLPEMSMGMSSDLEVAIACGATIVRVGTAIFGER